MMFKEIWIGLLRIHILLSDKTRETIDNVCKCFSRDKELGDIIRKTIDAPERENDENELGM